mmetsp:Transcript_6921/g.19587  ORF Transcript_6921/g.19587 Transcript_6921/m.19587 type:complete len:272 (-) Transcript_6921:305-1120(-)
MICPDHLFTKYLLPQTGSRCSRQSRRQTLRPSRPPICASNGGSSAAPSEVITDSSSPSRMSSSSTTKARDPGMVTEATEALDVDLREELRLELDLFLEGMRTFGCWSCGTSWAGLFLISSMWVSPGLRSFRTDQPASSKTSSQPLPPGTVSAMSTRLEWTMRAKRPWISASCTASPRCRKPISLLLESFSSRTMTLVMFTTSSSRCSSSERWPPLGSIQNSMPGTRGTNAAPAAPPRSAQTWRGLSALGCPGSSRRTALPGATHSAIMSEL